MAILVLQDRLSCQRLLPIISIILRMNLIEEVTEQLSHGSVLAGRHWGSQNRDFRVQLQLYEKALAMGHMCLVQ